MPVTVILQLKMEPLLISSQERNSRLAFMFTCMWIKTINKFLLTSLWILYIVFQIVSVFRFSFMIKEVTIIQSCTCNSTETHIQYVMWRWLNCLQFTEILHFLIWHVLATGYFKFIQVQSWNTHIVYKVGKKDEIAHFFLTFAMYYT